MNINPQAVKEIQKEGRQLLILTMQKFGLKPAEDRKFYELRLQMIDSKIIELDYELKIFTIKEVKKELASWVSAHRSSYRDRIHSYGSGDNRKVEELCNLAFRAAFLQLIIDKYLIEK